MKAGRETHRFACLGLVSFVLGGAIAPACAGAHASPEVAAVHLTCLPVASGVRCQLLALSGDASRPALDVTRPAIWRLWGLRDAQISPDGFVDSRADGDVEIDGQFAHRSASIHVRLAHGRPGQVLAVVRGQVYVETPDRLRPVAGARIEIVAGSSAGLSTSTDEDGGYELVGIVPGYVVVRAVMVGHGAGECSTEVYAGDNRVSVLIDIPPDGPVAAAENRDTVGHVIRRLHRVEPLRNPIQDGWL